MKYISYYFLGAGKDLQIMERLFRRRILRLLSAEEVEKDIISTLEVRFSIYI